MIATTLELEGQPYQKNVSSGVISARFYATMRQEHGPEFLYNEVFYDGSVMMSAFRVWKYSTEEGREWSRWANGLHQRPDVDATPNDLEVATFEAAVAKWRQP